MNENVATESQDVEGLEQDGDDYGPVEPDGTPLYEDENKPGHPYFNYKLIDGSVDAELFTLDRANPGDAAFDLRACLADGLMRMHGIALPPMRAAQSPTLIGTGIAVEIPEGYAGLVLPRSGLAAKFGITIANAPGLIDSGYRGEVKLSLVNHGARVQHIKHGDRVAQLLIVPAPLFVPAMAYELSESARGTQGLGSTGVE